METPLTYIFSSVPKIILAKVVQRANSLHRGRTAEEPRKNCRRSPRKTHSRLTAEHFMRRGVWPRGAENSPASPRKNRGRLRGRTAELTRPFVSRGPFPQNLQRSSQDGSEGSHVGGVRGPRAGVPKPANVKNTRIAENRGRTAEDHRGRNNFRKHPDTGININRHIYIYIYIYIYTYLYYVTCSLHLNIFDQRICYI